MDQFKKIYKPVLKTLKPGEKRENNEGVPPKFDFSKRFAEMMNKDQESSNSELKIEKPIEESTQTPIIQERKETLSPDFKIPRTKLDFNRPGLLNVPQNDIMDQTSVRTDSEPEEESLDFSSELITSEQANDLTTPHQSPKEESPKPSVPIEIIENNLDKTILDCREKLLAIDALIAGLDNDLPHFCQILDAMLHNLKLELLLDLDMGVDSVQ